MKINNEPRISVNPLCEYVVSASATKRNGIIRNCKRPLTFITKWYNTAEELLAFYLSNIRDEPKVLQTEIARIKTKKYADEMEEKYANASAEALHSFLGVELKIREVLAPFSVEMAVNDSKHKFINNGVKISLRPEIILRDCQGKQQLGFVKFYFSKCEPLGKDRGELMACLIKHYFEQEFAFKFKNQHCFVLDVYNGILYTSPNSFKKRISDINAACKEIADRWDRVLV